MKKILLVDDDAGILEAVKAVLEYEGFEVIINSTGNNIISELKDNPPELILLDFLISGRHGTDIAKELKTHPVFKTIPIIMLSAHSSAQDAVKNSDIDDFLAKPFDITDLTTKIRKYLA